MNDRHVQCSRARARRCAALLLCAALGLATGLGCSRDEKAEQTRELLKPRALKRTFEGEQRQTLYGEDGELLPSEQTVAGIVLPRGLTLYKELDNQWFYRSTRVPPAKLESYFSRRLMRTGVERGEGWVTFLDAVPVTDVKVPKLRVQIESLRGAANSTQVYIRQAVPFVPKIPLDQVEAQLRAARERAD